MANVQKDLGPVSAYAIAVKHGYNGTEEEWAALQIAAAGNAAAAASSAKAAADTLAAVEETVAQATGEAVQAVEAQEAESVKAVEEAAGAACTVQEEKIAQKGAETLASIPPEYADLVEQVNRNSADLLTKAPSIECAKSGALVAVTDAAAQCAVTLISQMAPVQAGDGDPNPDNVRPISGWDSVSVTNDATDQILTADLPETVYGGSLNWGTGVLTVEWLATKVSNLTWKNGGDGTFYIDSLYTKRAGAKIMCDAYKTIADYVSVATMPDATIKGRDNSLQVIYIRDRRFSTAAEFAAAMGDAVIAYECNAPRTIQLAPQQLDMLKGANNVHSSTGNVSIVYVADTKLYIDNRIAAIAAAVINA